MTILQFKNINKSFFGKKIYKSLNLNINKGETISIFGGSGSGKSVLLKILIGLIKADSGEIIYKNENILNFNDEQFLDIRKDIAMLFQGAALFDSINVENNISYPLRMHKKFKEKEIKKIVSEKLKMVGLSGIEKLMPSELSGGMQKRVGLARALAVEPKIMLYDEPTTGLDPTNVNLIINLIKKLQKELSLTSIIVTQDIEAAFKLSDRVAMLWDKNIIFTGTVEEIKKSKNKIIYNFINGIIG